MFDTIRKNEKGEVEIAVCPLCDLRVEFIGAPMVRCYTTGETYDPEEIIWVLESKIPKDLGYDVENIREMMRRRIFCPMPIEKMMKRNIDGSFSCPFFSSYQILRIQP